MFLGSMASIIFLFMEKIIFICVFGKRISPVAGFFMASYQLRSRPQNVCIFFAGAPLPEMKN
jgi:hypothetical protein